MWLESKINFTLNQYETQNKQGVTDIIVKLHKCRSSSFGFPVALMLAERTQPPENL